MGLLTQPPPGGLASLFQNYGDWWSRGPLGGAIAGTPPDQREPWNVPALAMGFGPSNIGQGAIFYRGTNPGNTARIKTGLSSWDDNLFVTKNIDDALLYGSDVETIRANPEARILTQGTKEFKTISKGIPTKTPMLEWAEEIRKRALAAGYDAVAYERQGDIGTVIMNPAKFARFVKD